MQGILGQYVEHHTTHKGHDSSQGAGYWPCFSDKVRLDHGVCQLSVQPFHLFLVVLQVSFYEWQVACGVQWWFSQQSAAAHRKPTLSNIITHMGDAGLEKVVWSQNPIQSV